MNVKTFLWLWFYRIPSLPRDVGNDDHECCQCSVGGTQWRRRSERERERGPVWVCDGILMLLRLLLCFLQPRHHSLCFPPSSPPAWQWWGWLFDRFQWIWSLVGSARIIWLHKQQQRHRSLTRAAYSYVLAPTPMQLPLFPNIQIDPVSNMQPRARQNCPLWPLSRCLSASYSSRIFKHQRICLVQLY